VDLLARVQAAPGELDRCGKRPLRADHPPSS
jgi:hypothetical protein